jgi:cytochrome c oxidase cbb3-type subunit III
MLIDRHIFSCAILLSCMTATSCKREQRNFRVLPPADELSENIAANNPVRPGPLTSGTPSTSQPVSLERLTHEPFAYQFPQNAQSLSDGQFLFDAFNCSGCHAHGGGGMAPPLMDRKWLYGSNPDQVYTTIIEGRPNGMPSYRGRIPDFQVWELVAYVRSLSGQANPSAASGREEHMATEPPPNSIPKQSPIPETAPATKPAKGEVVSPGKALPGAPRSQPASTSATQPTTSE